MWARLHLGSVASWAALTAGCGTDVTTIGSNVANVGGSGDSCMEGAAFCAPLDEPAPGGRGGELDERVFSVARWGHFTTEDSLFVKPTVVPRTADGETEFSAKPSFCGATITSIDAPDDFRICTRRDSAGNETSELHEVLHDAGDVAVNAMRIRQPFDFTDRTGKLVFAVDAKINYPFDGHGYWTEIWITEDPAPLPQSNDATMGAYPRNGVGFVIQPSDLDACSTSDGKNQVGFVVVSKNYAITTSAVEGDPKCFRAKDGVPNRFELRISRNGAEFRVTDWDAPEAFQSVSTFAFDLGFSTGYVHLEHKQRDANKATNEKGIGATPAQTFRWSGVAFDGPALPLPRGYDVEDPLGNVSAGGLTAKRIGTYLEGSQPKSFDVRGVDLTGATGAAMNFNYFAGPGDSLEYTLNGGKPHGFTVPEEIDDGEVLLRSFSVPVALGELVDGDNTLTMRNVETGWVSIVGNLDLTIDTAP